MLSCICVNDRSYLLSFRKVREKKPYIFNRTPELYRACAKESQEPVPNIKAYEDHYKSSIANRDKTHETSVFFVKLVVPDVDLGHEVVSQAYQYPEDEKQEVTLVVQADAVVYPGTVVVHKENAGVARRAMVGSHGFYVVAFGALFIPELPQVF